MRPRPLLFQPSLHAKPWGGCGLRSLGKSIGPDQRIGESWEVCGLPGYESRGRDGGLGLRETAQAWGVALLDGWNESDPAGCFPLLIKFLDAREHLSVQVHPKPDGPQARAGTGSVKHEAWYVVQAAPDACVFIGLQPGVTPAQVQAAAGGPDIVPLLRRRPVRAGDCFYLPSGTPHALGAGVMVAEVQTPSDTTYRLYDWDRRDERGQPRALHLTESLANIRYDVREDEIIPPRKPCATAIGAGLELVNCPSFRIAHVRLTATHGKGDGLGDPPARIDAQRPFVLITLSGEAVLSADTDVRIQAGDVAVVPSQSVRRVHVPDNCELLEVEF